MERNRNDERLTKTGSMGQPYSSYLALKEGVYLRGPTALLFLPSPAAAQPSRALPERRVESSSLPAAGCLPRRPSPPLTQLENTPGRQLGFENRKECLNAPLFGG